MTPLEKAMSTLTQAGDAELRKLYVKKKDEPKKEEEGVSEEDLALLERSFQKE